ncbi:MAG: hypothetical protein HYY17_13215 [Planctomycetes bacterium]|nr:hypothetical protein [Planctomycetota bacterium]
MNEEIRGVTAIDTMYELKGFQMAQSFYEVIFPWAIGVLAATAVVHILFMADRTRRFRDIVIYSGYFLVMLYLAHPIKVNVAVPAGYVWEDFEAFYREYERGSKGQPMVKAPRFMVWSHILCDGISKILINQVNKSFVDAPFGMERLSALLRQARIHDSDLQERYQAFVLSCYVPAMTMYGPSGSRAGKEGPGPFLNPFNVPHDAYAELWYINYKGEYDPNRKCDQEAREIYALLRAHVLENGVLRETAQEVHSVLRRHGQSHGDQFLNQDDTFVLNHVVYNETAALFNVASGEIARLQRALPEYGMFKTSQQTASNPQGFVDVVRSVISFVVKAKQSVDQWFEHHAEGPKAYYQVTNYAPYVYGLSMMVITAMFPIAAFATFWPWRWTVLLTWCKYLLWIKLWMVFWAMLAEFNRARYEFTIGDDPSNGIGDQNYIFPAIAAMYLVAPGLALLVVQLLDAARAAAVSAISHIAAGPGASQFFQFQNNQQQGGAPPTAPRGGGGSAGGGGGASGGGAGAGAGGGGAGAAAAAA